MFKRFSIVLFGTLVALGLVGLTLWVAHADGAADPTWTTDTFFDFRQGTMDGVDVWRAPGTVRLDYAWQANVRVNDYPVSQSRFDPRLSFALVDAGAVSETVFLMVWADERVQDHYPDIYFSQSSGDGGPWSSDVLVSGAHVDGRSQNKPDIGVRAADESLWVVWQDDRRDDGDIFYAFSGDQGAHWSVAAPVYTGTGTQRAPRLAPHGLSGNLYLAWEDARAGDDGDVYLSRFNPDEMVAWSVPFQIHDDVTPAAAQRRPALTVDAAGNVYAVWEDTRENDDGEIYFSRWLSGTAWNASTWRAPVRLSDPEMDWGAGPDIVAAPGGGLYAAWMERVPTGPASSTYDFQIVVARSQDRGETWTPGVVQRLYAASATNASYFNPALGVDWGGRVYVAWMFSPDQQASSSDVLLAVSPDRGQHWTVPRTLSRPAGDVDVDTLPALVTDFEGRTVVAWQDFRDGASTQIYATGYPSEDYLTRGEYRTTFDAGGLVAWQNITWTVTGQPGAGLTLATRVRVSASAQWSDWVTHTVLGEVPSHPSAQFIQYRAVLTGAGGDTPALDAVSIAYKSQYYLYLPLVLRQ